MTNLRKIIYVLTECGICFESLTEAENWAKEYQEENGGECPIERFIYFPRKCTHCGHFELMSMVGNEPWNPVHHQCPACDSTFTTSEP